MTFRPSSQQHVLSHIRHLWGQLPQERQPWGVWIRHYPPCSETMHQLDPHLFPAAVWFLRYNYLRPHNLGEWQRFYVVHSEQPWCQRLLPEPSGIFGRVHHIGLAAFAQYDKSSDYYLEYQWGGTFGRGARVTVLPSGDIQQRSLFWVS